MWSAKVGAEGDDPRDSIPPGSDADAELRGGYEATCRAGPRRAGALRRHGLRSTRPYSRSWTRPDGQWPLYRGTYGPRVRAALRRRAWASPPNLHAVIPWIAEGGLGEEQQECHPARATSARRGPRTPPQWRTDAKRRIAASPGRGYKDATPTPEQGRAVLVFARGSQFGVVISPTRLP